MWLGCACFLLGEEGCFQLMISSVSHRCRQFCMAAAAFELPGLMWTPHIRDVAEYTLTRLVRGDTTRDTSHRWFSTSTSSFRGVRATPATRDTVDLQLSQRGGTLRRVPARVLSFSRSTAAIDLITTVHRWRISNGLFAWKQTAALCKSLTWRERWCGRLAFVRWRCPYAD